MRDRLAELGERLQAADRFGDALVPDSIARAQLGTGLPGLALAHAYLGQEAAALRRLEETFAALPTAPGLSGGLAGVGWVVAHLAREGLLASDPELLEPIDERLMNALVDLPHDWAFGLAGVIVYAIERGATELGRAAADRLVELAEWHEDHAWFRTRPDARWLGADEAARFPEGRFDLGMAHGAAGVVAALRLATESFPDGARWRAVADAAQGTLGDGGMLDASRRPLAPPHRLGWCYGAPGILFAGGDARAEGPLDGLGLCHGAAGVLTMARRLGDEVTAERALATLLSAPPPEAPGLLDGVAGLALALTALLDPRATAWQRLFLLPGSPGSSR